MRRYDILWLALAALYQQKLRTVLTTLGVLFGSFVLTFSVSMARGVQDAIVREYSRYAGLRHIEVRPNFAAAPASESEDKVEVAGNPGPEKRRRLQHEIARHARRTNPGGRQIKLTPDLIRRVQELPHVKEVNPDVAIYGRATLGRKSEEVLIHSAQANDSQLKNRLVAGSYLESDSSDAAVVSEYLLYLLGIVDDKAVEGVIGKKLRLEYRTGTNKPNALLMLFSATRAHVGLEEQELLEKVVKKLPQLLDKLDLAPAEKEFLRKLLQPPTQSPAPESGVFVKEFKIAGVIRSGTKEERRPAYFDWWLDEVDVVLPAHVALEWFFDAPANRESGLQRLMVEADSIDAVKPTSAEIVALGLGTTSLVELIEREQFTYTLMGGVMTCIAGVALLVAALGIINTMLMSVLERIREIGIMKAVGARNRHILTIFLVEGALIGLVGGLLGLLLAWLASIPGDAWIHSLVAERMQLQLQGSLYVWPVWLLVGAPVFTCLVTTLAAVLPARRAAAVNPIKALRHE